MSRFRPVFRLSAILLVLAASWLHAQDTTISYQGQLKRSGSPFTGQADMSFQLYDALIGGQAVGPGLARSGVPVEDGIFQVELDFGPEAFGDALRFLELRVDGTLLEPRQPIRPAPVALFALDGNQGPEGPVGPPGPAEPPLFDPLPSETELQLFLRSPDVTGSDAVRGFEGWVPVRRFRTAVDLAVSFAVGGGGGETGLPSFQPMSVELESDAWTADFFALLMQASATGFEIVSCSPDATGPDECFQSIRMTTSLVTRTEPLWSDRSGRFLLEVDIEYGQFEWELRSAEGGSLVASWNRETATGSFLDGSVAPLFGDGGAGSTGRLALAGITGDLADGRIATFASDQAAELPVSFGSGTGFSTGRPDISRLGMNRRTDAAGPELFHLLTTGQVLAQGRLDWAGDQAEGFVVFEEAFVTRLEINSTLRERLELLPTRAFWSVGGNGFGWDRQLNEAWTPSL